MGTATSKTVVTMKPPSRIVSLFSAAALAMSLAAGIVFSAPAKADPPSGSATTVEMAMPGASQSADGPGPRGTYQPPPVTIAVQGGTGGVDRDGTAGVVDPDGTEGRISGPQIRAVPEIRANPAPLSPRIWS